MERIITSFGGIGVDVAEGVNVDSAKVGVEVAVAFGAQPIKVKASTMRIEIRFWDLWEYSISF